MLTEYTRYQPPASDVPKPAAADVPKTSEEELRRILAEQAVELDWWKDYPNMQTPADIQDALVRGAALEVPPQGPGYKISAKVPEQFRVLEFNTRLLLDIVAEAWLKKLSQKGINTGDVFLVVSSLGRTTEYQEELRRQGYPAAPESTHTKLGAFDIAVDWFKQNKPELLEALDEVLEEIKKQYGINWILEPEVGAYHVASNPAFKETQVSV